MTRDALIEETKKLKARVAQLEKQVRNYGWEREYLRQEQYDKAQAERSKWGIYG